MILIILDEEMGSFKQERHFMQTYELSRTYRTDRTNNAAAIPEAVNSAGTDAPIAVPVLSETELFGNELSGMDLSRFIFEKDSDIHTPYAANRQTNSSAALEHNHDHFSLKPVRPDQFADAIHRAAECINQMDADVSAEIWIQTFNRFEVLLSGKPLKWNRSKARELMALLVHRTGHRIGKYTICDFLWPDNDPVKALVQLQTTMCALRKCLVGISRNAMSIEYSNGGYRLKLGNVKYDKVQFLEYVELFKKTKDTHWAEEAASLHDSGYFAEEAWSWAIESTENLRTQYEKLVSDIAASRS